MRVLLTGGNGLVGRNVLARVAGKHEVFSPPRGELDLLDALAVSRSIRTFAPDIVIHCAGIVGGIQANIREPVRFLAENFEMGKNVVLGAAEIKVRSLLNLGSSCMYPRNAPNPLREDSILKGELEPTNEGYALAKIAVQRLCAYVSRQDPALAYKTAVPCNLYGKWDKFDPRYSHMIPAVIRKLHEARLRGDTTVSIWGTGTARREFMYAGDLADFVSHAMEHFDDMPEVLNVGLGYDYSVDDYYHAIAEAVGFRGTFTHDTSKPEGMAQKLLDISALTAFGWKAPTRLSEGITITYSYFREEERGE